MAIPDMRSLLGRTAATSSYVPEVDAMRVLAIAPVLIWHASLRGLRFFEGGWVAPDRQEAALGYLPQGNIGVVLFFVISGFIISRPFLKSDLRFSLGDYLKRRFLRIWPTYMVVLIACMLILSAGAIHLQNVAGYLRPGDPLLQSFLASTVFAHGLLFHTPPRLNPPLWSLEVEIQFYVIAPLLLLILLRVRDARARMAVTAALVVAALLLRCGLDDVLGAVGPHRWSVLAYLHYFLLGILFGLYAAVQRPLAGGPRYALDLVMAAGVVLLVLSGVSDDTQHPFALYLAREAARTAGCLLIFIGVFGGRITNRIFRTPALAALGAATYAIYMTHVPVMQATATILFRIVHPGSLAASLGVALTVLVSAALVVGIAFFVLVEQPLSRRLLSARRPPVVRPD